MGVKDFSLNPRKMFAWARGVAKRRTVIAGADQGLKMASGLTPAAKISQKSSGRIAHASRRKTRRTSVLLLSAFLLINYRLVLADQNLDDSSRVIKATRAMLGRADGLNMASNNYKTPKLSVRSKLQYDKRIIDLRWPGRQLNVLVDRKSLNDTEQAVLASVFQQIEHRTCVHIHSLSPERVNPFAVHTEDNQVSETERHFVYIFKSPGRNGDLIFGRHPSMGLSSLGCVKQGRQSLVLTELAFKWPELVLRYHVMRSLGVDNLERPDGNVRRLLNMLPLNQKIASGELLEIETQPHQSQQTATTNPDSSRAPSLLERWSSSAVFEPPTLVAQSNTKSVATSPGVLFVHNASSKNVQFDTLNVHQQPIGYLSEDDLEKIKDLYDCKDYQNKLSPIPADASEILNSAEAAATQGKSGLLHGPLPRSDAQLADANFASGELNPKKFKFNDESGPERDSNPLSEPSRGAGDSESSSSERGPSLSREAAKRIVDSLLNNPDDVASGRTESEISSDRTSSGCKSPESCPVSAEIKGSDHRGAAHHDEGAERFQEQQERPMILKLDEYHAQDPQLRQANQMKLSQLSNDTLETYRLMNNPTNLADFLLPSPQSDSNQRQIQPQEQLQPDTFQNVNHWQRPKSEMLISFEQSNNQHGDPVSALASSQLLKLCSCTCQTMTPKAPPTPNPLPASPTSAPTIAPTTTPPVSTPTATTEPMPEPSQPESPQPTISPMLTEKPTIPTEKPITPADRPTFPTDPGPPKCEDYDGDYDENGCHSPATPTSSPSELPPATLPPSPMTPPEPAPIYEPITTPPTEAPTPATATTTPAPATTTELSTEPVTSPETTAPASITETHTESIPSSSVDNSTLTTTTSADHGGLFAASACDQVEWVKPNKTVYASARIVWDVDRANQNYFLCNNQLNGELIPGKTHGFYCKISQEGKALEAHNFNVLTKPEHVNLAWIQKDSKSFGRTNFPVVGGYSKQQDPYIVSRCLVKDENSDIITLIGYINNQGVGWFPFDDIQIECGQYDVLACVN